MLSKTEKNLNSSKEAECTTLIKTKELQPVYV
jgi:hypothetical protein